MIRLLHLLHILPNIPKPVCEAHISLSTQKSHWYNVILTFTMQRKILRPVQLFKEMLGSVSNSAFLCYRIKILRTKLTNFSERPTEPIFLFTIES